MDETPKQPDQQQTLPTPKVHEKVGVANGAEVLDFSGNPTGEKVVYDYNDAGEFIGWHKEAING